MTQPNEYPRVEIKSTFSSQPNEQLIEDIQKALEQFEASDVPEEILKNVRVIHVHSVLWLRALLEKIEGMQWKIDAQGRVQRVGDDHYRESVKPIRHLFPFDKCPGIGQLVELFQQTREELEQVKAERNKFYDRGIELTAKNILQEATIESLRTELSAKDKVLEWIANADPKAWGTFRAKARSILSQYTNRTETKGEIENA
jgi:hypothetical protein